MKLNLRLILSFIGLLLVLNGIFMFLCIPYSLYYHDGDLHALLISGAINIGVGLLLYFSLYKKYSEEVKRRDGYLIVTLGWVTISLFGTLPYLLSGSIPSFTNAFFEAISGYTTTGASILSDIEAMPKGILLWRSMTQWIGGMGIIVLTVAILPLLGVGGMQLFVSEAPGISPDKLTPRINETARRLWSIYVGLTVLETIILKLGGMDLYDALNHSLTTMATGGFSTKQDSLAHFDSAFIQYVVIIFMFIAGINFTLTFHAIGGKWKKLTSNEEFKAYYIVILFFTFLTTIALLQADSKNFEESFREALFQIVSIISTTGFATTDYTSWETYMVFIILIIMFIGGSAGSTAGGVKIIRHLILFKNSILELRRLIHPSAVIAVRINKRAIGDKITYNVLAFIIIYVVIFAVGSALLAFTGVDFTTSIGAVATSLANIGPGLGEVGPAGHFGNIPDASKWILTFLMLLGRLELFTVLILFTTYFWSTS
ncbi:MAG: TrkH family potassium uptake protein [Chitinophagales bacterium]|nr:TrkH family potassium uptake protein [Chitinophagales bacterium]